MKRLLLIILTTLFAGLVFCAFFTTGLGYVISDDTVELARRTVCFSQQRCLYLLLEEYKKTQGELPSTLSQLVDKKYMRMKNLFCPEASSGWIGRSYYGPQPSSDENIRLYEYFPENYGDPNSVLISENEENHSQGLILMHLQPVVIQTMGNGITTKLCKEEVE